MHKRAVERVEKCEKLNTKSRKDVNMQLKSERTDQNWCILKRVNRKHEKANKDRQWRGERRL
jgi:hypothetical protein